MSLSLDPVAPLKGGDGLERGKGTEQARHWVLCVPRGKLGTVWRHFRLPGYLAQWVPGGGVCYYGLVGRG